MRFSEFDFDVVTDPDAPPPPKRPVMPPVPPAPARPAPDTARTPTAEPPAAQP